MKAVVISLTLYVFLCCFLAPLQAQEENAVAAIQGKKYIDLRIKDLDKYNIRVKQQQEKLLKKLKKKEARLARKLKNNDSLTYTHFSQQTVTYDSIQKLATVDSPVIHNHSRNGGIDSLKGINQLLQQSQRLPFNANSGSSTNADINNLQGQLSYRNYINELIAQRTSDLKRLAAGSDVVGFTSIEKTSFYGRSKMDVYKEMADDPSKAEDKALEYLEGTEGFDKAVNNANGAGIQGMPSGNLSADDLKKMGYQTRQMLQTNLQQKFGANLGNMAGNLGKQLSQFQDQAKDITSQINDGINQAKDTKQFLLQAKNINAPSFRINPVRGLPFQKRLQRQYSWQTTRPTTDGQPAMLTASAMIGYKQTQRLVYGVGVAGSMGLGQDWNNVHLSFQGLGMRSYMTWQWQYGIGIYAGYERMYKQAVFINNNEPAVPTVADPSPHNTETYTESVLIGLTKSYKINSKYSGAIQVLYNIWWKEDGLNTPLVLRFTTMTN